MTKPIQLSNKYIVGVTGGIGCGKTTVTDLFAAKGINIVDADVLAREVVVAGSVGLSALVKAFGSDILNEQQTLNRAALRELIFTNASAKEKVNNVLHPLIRENILNQLQNTQSHYCMLSAPLLFENNLHTLVNRSLVIDITEELQLKRTIKRDGGNTHTIKSIIKAQITREKRLALSDDIIDNSNALNLLAPQVNNLHQTYTTRASNYFNRNA